jgi:hypothetical protein
VRGVLGLLLAAACFAPPAQYHGLAVRPLNPHTFFVASPFTRAYYAYDGTFEYVGTAIGLYRTLSLAGTNFDLILPSQVNGVNVQNGVLYALLQGGDTTGPVPLNHTVFRSTDTGVTFTTLDAGLQECSGGFCRFLPATQIDFAPGRIFLAAGGNFLVSADNGVTWKALYPTPQSGPPATQVCPMTFGRSDTSVVIAGKCPTDQAYVAIGTLRTDLTDWAVPPMRLTPPAQIPQLDNRNAQFVAHVADEIYVGLEGALLKSCDGGATFHFVVQFPASGSRYPVIQQFIAPVKYPGVRIVGGFDQATSGPYLAWSADSGETWMDATAMLPRDSSVALLTERRDGLPMIFIQRGTTISMSQLVITAQPARHRAVGK